MKISFSTLYKDWKHAYHSDNTETYLTERYHIQIYEPILITIIFDLFFK